MIVTCHNCATKLQLDPAKVPSRAFSVRCPKCQQIVNAQPPAAAAQRDALAAVGDVPASTRTQQEAVASPPPATLLREEPAAGDGKDDVLSLLAAVLRREAGAEAQGAPGSGRRHTWESRRALVCVGSGQGTEAARALADEGYAVMPVADAAQAVERMREERVDVIVLDREFDPRGQGAVQVARELTSMRTAERRRVVLVMLSEAARTGDAHAAFLVGANLVVHLRDAAELPRHLERNIHDLNDLYRDFNKALGLAQL
jgi:predicted Zn finger-like uncharacterized protein